MKKWLNNTIYPCKKLGIYPLVYVERDFNKGKKLLKISIFPKKGESGITIVLPIQYMRLLAKRILMALEN